jgi:hypothetical protein
MGKQTKGIDIIKEIIAKYKMAGHPIEILGADEGEVSQADHRIITTESMLLLLMEKIKFLLSEPYNHANGGQYVEFGGNTVKNKMRLAFKGAFLNLAIPKLNWSDSDLLYVHSGER